MTSTPQRISLVLPYYNEAAFILPTLESIAAQDTRDFRLIIVNNRSDDASPAMVKRFLAPAISIFPTSMKTRPAWCPR